MRLHEAIEKAEKLDKSGCLTVDIEGHRYNYNIPDIKNSSYTISMRAAVSDQWDVLGLTFETIRRECEPMKHLLVSADGKERLYLGFNREGRLITDNYSGESSLNWLEISITNWAIKKIQEK